MRNMHTHFTTACVNFWFIIIFIPGLFCSYLKTFIRLVISIQFSGCVKEYYFSRSCSCNSLSIMQRSGLLELFALELRVLNSISIVERQRNARLKRSRAATHKLQWASESVKRSAQLQSNFVLLQFCCSCAQCLSSVKLQLVHFRNMLPSCRHLYTGTCAKT